MQRNQEWKGLVTHASAFSLEAGQTQQQVNLHSRHPGKLESRSGLAMLSSQPMALDVWSLPSTQSSILLSLNTSGELVMSRTLTGTTSTYRGYEPPLSSQKGQTITNYLWQYQTDGGSVNDLVYVFYGGNADQQDWDYKLDAEGQCIPAQNPYPTGDATLTEIIGVDPDGLCDYDSNRQ